MSSKSFKNIFSAVKKGVAEDVKFFVEEKGIDINVKDGEDMTPLHHAVTKENIEIVSYLVSKGADTHARNWNKATPLQLTKNIEIARFLISQGADINTKGADGWSPLHFATYWQEFDIAKFLVSQGADIEAKDDDGETPLHLAASEGNMEYVKFFVSKGADVNATNKKGKTPLDLAKKRRKNAVIEFLSGEKPKNSGVKSWELENVLETSLKHKGTFFIPDEAERNNQKINNEVQLLFQRKNPVKDEPSAQKMWVRITNISKDNHKLKYTGIIIDYPKLSEDLDEGEEIEFGPDNIAKILIKKDDPRWLDFGDKFAFVSKKVFENDGVIRFIYHEEPDNEEVSGWNLFAGTEDDDYVNDPENIRMERIDYMLSVDPSLLEPFKNGHGAVAFERDGRDAEWQKIDDWMPLEEE